MQKIRSLHFPAWTVPLALLGVAVLGYGIFIPWFKLYGDDWIYLWNYHLFGAGSFGEFVAGDRPYSAWIYSLVTGLFGERYVYYHILLVALRWTSAVLFWWVIGFFWPGNSLGRAGAALLMLLYPGFKQQPIPLEFMLHFAVLSLFLASLGLMALSLRKTRWPHWPAWPLTVLAMACSASMFSLEYFIGLELARPLLIWAVLKTEKPTGLVKSRLWVRIILCWLPYLFVLAVFLAWRIFVFRFQFYRPILLDQLSANPINALAGLALRILTDLKTVTWDAWRQIFSLPPGGWSGRIPDLALTALGLVLTGLFLLKLDPARDGDSGQPGLKVKRTAGILLASLFLLLVAGAPFWAPVIPVAVVFPWDRSSLPFILGSSLALAGLVTLVPQPRIQVLFLAGLVGLSLGAQYQNALVYRQVGSNAQAFFWQLSWRAPRLQPGTILISDKIPLDRFSDNDMTPILNWTYAPDLQGHAMPYQLFDLETRENGGLPGFKPGLPVTHTSRTMGFTGSTSNILAVYLGLPGCLHVLSSEEATLPGLTDDLRQVLPLSHSDLIGAPSAAEPAAEPPSMLFPEPAHTWCYLYEKADLARQLNDWQKVTELGDQAAGSSLKPADLSEYLPFIEGYAHVQNWDRADALSKDVHNDPELFPSLCTTWKRIASAMASNNAASTKIGPIRIELGCML
jgi:hypothetical protein